jgi:hypothetical protein
VDGRWKWRHGRRITLRRTHSSKSAAVRSSHFATLPLLITPSTAITQTAVRLVLAEQDNHELQSGLPYTMHEEVTGSQLIVMGIDLEDAQ